MSDYKEKFDDFKKKARELDVAGLVEDTARGAGAAARKGAKTVAEGDEHLRAEAGRLADDPKLRENARRASDEARRHAKDAGKAIRDAATDAGKVIRDAAGPAGKKAEQVFDDAANYVGSAAKVAGKGFKATRASAAATAGLMKAK